VLPDPPFAPVGQRDVAELRVDEDPGLLVVLDFQREVVSYAFLIMAKRALTLPATGPVTYNPRVLASLLIRARAFLDDRGDWPNSEVLTFC
jgi:hypothetical protein